MEIIQTTLNTKENASHVKERLHGKQFSNSNSSGNNSQCVMDDCCYHSPANSNNDDLAIETNQIQLNGSSSRTDGQRPLKSRSHCRAEVLRNMLIALTTFKLSPALSVLSQPLTMICLCHLLVSVGAWMPDIRPDLPASEYFLTFKSL